MSKAIYILNRGDELFEFDPSNNKLKSLHNWDSYQHRHCGMYYIKNSGIISYKDPNSKEDCSLDVKAGEVIVLLEDDRPIVVHDEIFCNIFRLYLETNEVEDKKSRLCNSGCNDMCEKCVDRG